MNPDYPGGFDPPDPHDEPMFFIEELDEMFEMHRPYGRSETGFLAGRSFRPAANIHETPDGLELTLDVPGIERDDIDIRVENGRLIILGKRDFVREHADEEYVRLERGFGSFKRVFEVPSDADIDQVNAKLENGVLTVKVPRQMKRREIRVESEDVGE